MRITYKSAWHELVAGNGLLLSLVVGTVSQGQEKVIIPSSALNSSFFFF